VRRLVLASGSPARLDLLRSAGFAPEVVVSGVDESGVIGTPTEVCQQLAARKAHAVASLFVDAEGCPVVVGCDSMLEFDGELYGKPDNHEIARARWLRMSGHCGRLHSGQCVVDVQTGREAAAVASTVVRFGQPTDAELSAYLATGEPLAVAGGFTIDGYGAIFIDGIDGDAGTVIGLSLPLLRRLLADLGIPITDLWAR
jgi:septum formation protein